jgi:hypothetical protein
MPANQLAPGSLPKSYSRRPARKPTLKLGPELCRALETLARAEGYSLETMVALLLREALDARLRRSWGPAPTTSVLPGEVVYDD